MEEHSAFKASQNTMKFCFKNESGQEVNDLHVVFKKPEITVLDLGPFYTSGAEDKGNPVHTEVDLIKSTKLGKNKFACVTFQSTVHHDFLIEKWWWTLDNERVGDIQTTPPRSDEEED